MRDLGLKYGEARNRRRPGAGMKEGKKKRKESQVAFGQD